MPERIVGFDRSRPQTDSNAKEAHLSPVMDAPPPPPLPPTPPPLVMRSPSAVAVEREPWTTAAGGSGGPAQPLSNVTAPTRQPTVEVRLDGTAAKAEPVPHRRTLMDRLDTYISRLSTKNNFWHRAVSAIWMPYTFKSGLKMKKDEQTFSAVLPFRRINRNWYNAMAGAALLGNSEIAGGMYVFREAGGHYTVVCKHLDFKFLRPCYGPALYRITPREDLKALVAAGGEFNITLDLEVIQQIAKGGKKRRVGRCTATFHATPKVHQQRKGRQIRP